MNLSFNFNPTRKTRILVIGLSAASALAILLFGLIKTIYTSGGQQDLSGIIINYSLHLFVGLALVAGLTAPALMLQVDLIRKNRTDQALPRMLEDLAEGQEAGMTLLQALQESSKRDYGPISGELKILAAQLTWGVTFEDAFKSFAQRIGTDLISRVTILLLEAVRLGGDLKTTFNSTAAFVRKMIELRNDRETQLRAYLMVIYISTVVFMLIIVIMYQSLFIQMSQTRTDFMRLPLSLESYKVYLLDLAMLEAIIGGLTAGKLSEGVLLQGIKHSVLMLAAVLVIFTFFF